MALAGSGTEVDPWRITSMAELLVVLRDVTTSGFYRIANEIDTGLYASIGGLTTTNGFTYSPKVIDGDGYTVRFQTSVGSGIWCFSAYVHFKNIKIHYRHTSTADGTVYFNLRGGLTDCALYFSLTTSFSVTTSLAWTGAGVSALIPREIRRVALFSDVSPTNALSVFIGTSYTDFALIHVYVYSASPLATGITRISSRLTVAGLDALSASAFSENAWWDDGAYMVPEQVESVSLSVSTLSGGPVSRRICIENQHRITYIGDTAQDGVAQLTARVRKNTAFLVLASEDYGCDFLTYGKNVLAGNWYLSPTGNGYIYQAGGAGRITSQAAAVFNDQPVLIDGVTFTPRPRYQTVVSSRRSTLTGGLIQELVLDGAGGGGGPVLEGDPAYLDGVVEEMHPMLGTVRALVNAEVLVFEKRASGYVTMGSAFSNAVGEFRVNTEVYGGGDIFAFAADFTGVIWQAGVVLNLGDRVRPTVNNGYVYEVITAGNSGATEPTWWADAGDGTEGAIGSATAQARPYYQPVGHGPLKMTLVE